MQQIDFDRAFQQLNAELSKHGATLHLICVGGYMLQRMGIRSTLDVDAFYKSTQLIEEIISRLGDDHKINPANSTWLNNAVASINDWPESRYCKNVHTFSNLTVDEVTSEYLLGMKIRSGREQDILDAASLIKILKMEDPISAYQLLKGMAFDISIVSVIVAFTKAKGEDWSAAYYKEHSNDILSLLREGK